MDLTSWERGMDRMMDDFFARRMRPWRPERWSWPGDGEVGLAAVDVYEEKDDIIVKAELPGMDKNDIEVNIMDSTLTLKGEKKKEEKSRRKTTTVASVPMAAFSDQWSFLRKSRPIRSKLPLRTESWK
jgi:HSP20 family protein